MALPSHGTFTFQSPYPQTFRTLQVALSTKLWILTMLLEPPLGTISRLPGWSYWRSQPDHPQPTPSRIQFLMSRNYSSSLSKTKRRFLLLFHLSSVSDLSQRADFLCCHDDPPHHALPFQEITPAFVSFETLLGIRTSSLDEITDLGFPCQRYPQVAVAA